MTSSPYASSSAAPTTTRTSRPDPRQPRSTRPRSAGGRPPARTGGWNRSTPGAVETSPCANACRLVHPRNVFTPAFLVDGHHPDPWADVAARVGPDGRHLQRSAGGADPFSERTRSAAMQRRTRSTMTNVDESVIGAWPIQPPDQPPTAGYPPPAVDRPAGWAPSGPPPLPPSPAGPSAPKRSRGPLVAIAVVAVLAL